MKKITVLIAMFCVSVLNGMDSTSLYELPRTEPEQSHMEALSPEIKVMITQVLNAYDNNLSLEKNIEIILNNIKTLSQVNREFYGIIYDEYYNNSKGFKLLVHMIANKLTTQNGKAKKYPCDIAKKFNTPVANKYSELCEKLRSTLKKAQADKVKMQEVTKLLQEGADINGFPVLLAVVTGGSVPSFEMIRFLLNSGADPYATNYRGVTALRLFSDIHKSAHDYDKIRLLLQEAMKNSAK